MIQKLVLNNQMIWIIFVEVLKNSKINKREDAGLKYLNDPTACIEYSNDMNYIYKSIEEYNPNK